MEEARFWLRHPTLSGHQGPYELETLRAAFVAGSFPRDSYLLRDSGQNLVARQASTAWVPAGTVIGFPTPQPQQQPQPDPIRHVAIERLTNLREHTAYPGVRAATSLLLGLAFVALVLNTVVVVLGLAASMRWSWVAGLSVLTAIAIAFVEALALLVVGGLVQALLDIADSNVRRDPAVPQPPAAADGSAARGSS